MNEKVKAFIDVAVATFLASSVLVLFYGLGVRFIADATARSERGESAGLPRAAAWACFAVVGAAVLFGIYLIVPALGGKSH